MATVTALTRGLGSGARWLRPVAAGIVPVTLLTLAVLNPGTPVATVDLNDGAVWITNTSDARLGRYNPTVAELNAGIVATGSQFDVLQDAGDVLLVEPGSISLVDPVTVAVAATSPVPAGASVSMSGGTVAVSDRVTGGVWVSSVGGLATLNATTRDPDVQLEPGSTAVVTASGRLATIGASGSVVTSVVADGGLSDATTTSLPSGATGPWDQVSAVGDVPVVMAGSTLVLPSTTVDLGRYGKVVLQQPGPAAGEVAVAAPSALLAVRLSDGRVTEIGAPGQGVPAAPVRLGACIHGAWASATGSYSMICDDGTRHDLDLAGMTAASSLVFRVNRDQIVLNDVKEGKVWVPQESAKVNRPNWAEVRPDDATDDDAQQSDAQQTTTERDSECTAESAQPEAVDDTFGVRPGRTLTLSVIDNDASSDCGIVAISDVDTLDPDFGTLAVLHGGRALQLEVAPTASGSTTFTYTIADGRGTSTPSTATVTLIVRQPGENDPPRQVRVGTLTVEQTGRGQYDVLGDFFDPDGDDMQVVAVTAPSGTVLARPDGQITFTPNGSSLGRVAITVSVSDGMATTEGTLDVDVRADGTVAPTVGPLQVITRVGVPVTVDPLAVSTSGSREPVRLASVDQLAGSDIVTDLDHGTFLFTSARAGTYYVSFVVVAGTEQTTGIARIDVTEAPTAAGKPLAVRDVALLPPGGEVTIDPLANDEDPSGGVLVLQSVDVPAGSPIRAAVLGHQLVRLSSTLTIDGPITLSYTVSNGTGQAIGQITVLPTQLASVQQAPVVADIEAQVRTGGIVTIPVLESAYDPDGDELSLVSDLPVPVPASQGLLVVSGDLLRFQAGQEAGVVTTAVSVSDTFGNVTDAKVRITVHTSDATSKLRPSPADLTARVYQGETVRIPIPLTGIDVDGDGVVLLGQASAPSKGRVSEVGADYLVYEALAGESGTDTFTYAVEDWAGQRSVATIRVGIAPRPTTPAPLVARDDHVTIRPGETVEVRVLANDVDPSGSELDLSPQLQVAAGVVASVQERRIVVTAPNQAGLLQIGYTVTTARGASDTAVLTVTVSADASFAPPLARDVVVPAQETINRTTVEVDVLSTAENPSGPLSDLAVSVPAAYASIAKVRADGTVVVTLAAQSQTFPYQVTNTNPAANGVSTYAFITVPALGDFPPMLRPKAPAVRVLAGQQVVIDLDDYVRVAPGKTAQILDTSTVQATKSDGSSLVADARTLTYTPRRDYAGEASITFEVADGAAGELSTRRRVLTIPITVLAAEDYPPTFVASTIDVAPGEAAVTVDLRAFTSAPVGTATGTDVYTYAVDSKPSGFTVSLDGTVLSVSAPAAAVRGAVGSVGITLSYGVKGTLDASVGLRVVASARPLARVADVTVPDAVAGRATSVSVLDGAFNPFSPEPLSVVGAVVETPGAGTATFSSSSVSVTPAADFIGVMVVRYTVEDARNDPERWVEGRVTLIVRGPPSAPAAPRVTDVKDSAVTLSWDAPLANGDPIKEYRVVSTRGPSVTQLCATTTCVISGLTNGTTYQFAVAARNGVDWSPVSPPSPDATPDVVPDAPTGLVVTPGDESVRLSWTAPTNKGSAILRYEVSVSPAGPAGGTVAPPTPTATSMQVTGLSNGTRYVFAVKAVNGAGAGAAVTGAATPAREPDAPVLTATTGSAAGVGAIVVSWSAPNDHGAAVTGYELTVDGVAVADQPGPAATSWTLPSPARGTVYTFGLRAANAMGWSTVGSTTGQVWAVPSAPAGLTATDASHGAAYGSGVVEVTWSPPADDGGTAIDHYEIDGVAGPVTATSYTVTGLAGGVPLTISVRAVNVKNEAGPWASVPVTPVTLAAAPTITEDPSVPGRNTLTWAVADGGSPVTEYALWVDGVRTWFWPRTSTSYSLTNWSASPRTVEVVLQAITAVGAGATTTQTFTIPPP